MSRAKRSSPVWRTTIASSILPHLVDLERGGGEWKGDRSPVETACDLAQELADESCRRWGHTHYVSDGSFDPCYYCGAEYRLEHVFPKEGA